MNRCFCAVLAAVGFALTAVGQDPYSGCQTSVMQRICRRMEAVAAAVVSTNANVAADQAFAAFVYGVDPGGEICSPERRQQIENALKGVEYRWPLDICRQSNRLVVVSVDDGWDSGSGIAVGDRLIALDDVDEYVFTDEGLQTKLQVDRPGITSVVKLVSSRTGATNVYEVVSVEVRRATVEHTELFPRQIGYMKINGLYAEGDQQIVETLTGWRTNRLHGVVLDLRGAAGDSIDAVVDLVSWFSVGHVPLFSFRSRDGRAEGFCSSDVENGAFPFPVMLLVHEETSGAAEVLAISLAHHVSGVLLVGRETGGNPLVRDFVPVGDAETTAYLAVRSFIAGEAVFDGSNGMVPDIQVGGTFERGMTPKDEVTSEQQDADVRANTALQNRIGEDLILMRAADILLGLHALGFTQE